MALTGTRAFTTAGGLLAAAVSGLGTTWGLLAATGLLGAAALALPGGRRLVTPLLAFAALAIVAWAST